MKTSRQILFLAAVAMFVFGCGNWQKAPIRDTPPRMTIEELKANLNDRDLIILDVRAAEDWKRSDKKIQGSVREVAAHFAEWAPKYSKEKTLVLYCACPNDGTSAHVAQRLIGMGYGKVFALKGGWKAWETAGYPLEAKDAAD